MKSIILSAALFVAFSISFTVHKSLEYETRVFAILYLLSLYPVLSFTEDCFFVLNHSLLIDLFIFSSNNILFPSLFTIESNSCLVCRKALPAVPAPVSADAHCTASALRFLPRTDALPDPLHVPHTAISSPRMAAILPSP